MEKLSGILPSSPRVRSIDATKSQPARPGAPAFGRLEGKNSLGAAKAAFSAAAQASALEDMQDVPTIPSAKPYRPSAENQKMKIVEDISKRFFGGIKEDTEVTRPMMDEISDDPRSDVLYMATEIDLADVMESDVLTVDQ